MQYKALLVKHSSQSKQVGINSIVRKRRQRTWLNLTTKTQTILYKTGLAWACQAKLTTESYFPASLTAW